MNTGKPFETEILFAGGAGMFIQYHDVVKPTYLVAVIKLLLAKTDTGLPLDSIRSMSIISLVEWYLRRRHINPLRSLDYLSIYSTGEIDNMLRDILARDESIYHLAPLLNVQRLLAMYSKQNMNFPVYLYTEEEEPAIRKECATIFPGVPVKYLHGDLEKALGSCDQNFTYMVSDITLLEKLTKLLVGTCSHLLIAKDYRYNYNPSSDSFKINLASLMQEHPFVRIEINKVCDPSALALSVKNLSDRLNPERR